MPNRSTPIWLWPNLLSLDAPLVAVAWLHMFRGAWGVEFLPPSAYLALGLCVWAIYVFDRLIDVSVRPDGDASLGARHWFHRRHRGWFFGGALAALAVAAYLVLSELPVVLLQTYAVPAGTVLLAFFMLVAVSHGMEGIPYVRNVVAGLAFGFGTAIVAHAYVPAEEVGNLFFSEEMLSFSVLCMLNISAIHLWEHSRQVADPELKAMDELALTLPLILLGAFSMIFAYMDNRWMFAGGSPSVEHHTRPFFYAVLISTALLYVLNRIREQFPMDQLRCLADLAMVVPLPLFLVLSQA